MSHQGIIELIIAYTLAGAFVFTVVVTCLSLVGWIKFKDASQQRKLFVILIVELVTGSIGLFFNFMTLNPHPVITGIEDRALATREHVLQLIQEIDSLPEDAVLKLEVDASHFSEDTNRLVELRDPHNLRAHDAEAAKQMLKMRLAMGGRDPEVVNFWDFKIRSVKNPR